ncbi:MAG: 2OG-Fe(II) oxygenase [Phormidesmis sp. RL_2_1]|nr:2OG-Fe(II) oxygenase [Phormidesmis sp. RL_2_1]
MSPSNQPVSSPLTQYTEAPATKVLDLSSAGIKKLMDFGEDQRQQYLNSTPFPHIVIDNLFDHELLEAVRQDVIQLDQVSLASDRRDPHCMEPTARRFLLDLCSARFCLFLETLTGIEGLIPDPYFEGGGVHRVAAGGSFKTSIGSSWHQRLKLNQRLSLIIYLNPDWDERWGGQFELWDSDGLNNQRVSVLPTLNKTVIFSITEQGQHGYSSPLKCPDTVAQRSLSLHYYVSKLSQPIPLSPPLAQSSIENFEGIPYPAQGSFAPSPRGDRFTRVSKPARRKLPTILPTAFQKSLKKSVPKSLMNLYRAGKRSLRG